MSLLLVTRPQPEADRTAQQAKALGHEVVVAPLLAIEPLPCLPPSGRPDALLLTAGRAAALARAAWPGLPADLPVIAVGPATAAAARAAGFARVEAGASDGSAALRLAAGLGFARLLHARGEDAAPLMLPAGLELETRILYRAVPAARLPQAACAALARGATPLLFSARTAQVLAALLADAGLARGQIALAVLSPAVAQAAGAGWQAVAIAQKPTTEAILAAAEGLWHGRSAGDMDDGKR
ncbi:MAG: uroporphyrinogen-III synthase [Sphingomonadaceae bacterium]